MHRCRSRSPATAARAMACLCTAAVVSALAWPPLVAFAAPAPQVSARVPSSQQRLASARLQTALATANFSPGLVDGRPGRKTRMAIEAFQAASGLEVTGVPDTPTRAALKLPESARDDATLDGWTTTYTITQADADLITGPIPTDWNQRAELALSGYEHLRELLAERGWCHPDLLPLLNPGVDLDAVTVGDSVVLPASAATAVPLPRLARLRVHLAEKTIEGYDDQGRQRLLLHCSIARDMEKAPVGELAVTVVAENPEYTFNPASWPEVTNVDRKLRIAPGPRNPVGTAWVGLNRPGYGIHGTVRPQDIGKTGSHGCFRLANWDASRLARAVRIGTVVVVEP